MTTMDNVNKKVQTVTKILSGMFEWKRLSSVQKLIGLAIFASIVTVLMERWSLLIILIVTMMGFAYLTDRALTVGWLISPDPLAYFFGGLERCREILSVAYCRLFNTNPVSETQELRRRSESIASSHIPDLDIDIESGGSGSTFQKKTRLELNSIILLIIRDFVQFWYNTFSYNSQFLKDARQFLFRGFHNIVERVSRMDPHKTSAKLVHAYRKHIASFRTAQTMFDCQEKKRMWPASVETGKKTELKRLESVDEAFPLNFQFHPALKNKEVEKQYLRSLTKIILLCSCNRDVVSAQSAQLFFFEILSINVLLPVVEMLSTPDRIYEILIKLTYSDDGIVHEDTVKELIDVEVKRMQLKQSESHPQPESPMPVIAQDMPQSCKNIDVCADKTDASQNSGKCELTEDHEKCCPQLATGLSKTPETVAASHVARSTSKSFENLVVFQSCDESEKCVQKIAGNCIPNLGGYIADTDSDLSSSVVHKVEKTPVAESADWHEASVSKVEPEAEETLKLLDKSVVGSETDVHETQVELDKITVTSDAESVSTQNNHLYGEIVSTNIPVTKPKLQVFKDLFRSKKSKQTDEIKSQNMPDKDDGQKNQLELTAKSSSSSESILSTQRLKSLRLSPLLNRSSKPSSSENSSTSSTASQSSRDAGESKMVADSGSEKQTPSPQPTPSPSQPSKGGPLSFFRFRKPTLEFRKNLSAAVEEKAGDSLSSQTSSPPSDDAAAAASQPMSTLVPSVQISDESNNTSDNNRLPRPSPSSSDTSMDSGTRMHSVSISSYVEVSAESDLKMPQQTDSKKHLLFLGSGEEVEEGEEADCFGEEDGLVATPPDSSFIFQDISIPSTMTCQEFRSNSQFTVYQIEYEALHFSETGIPVMKTGTAKRRYREFVNLMSRLEDNSAYKRLLKDVKGPKRWMTLPFKNMDKESVASRQKVLEQFLKSLIEVEAVCNGPEMREFLAYEGDSHIAFVKKPTEINVPRIDKMLARTVSGVFDKLKSLPNLPQEMISGIRGRDTLVDRKDSTETDTDSICVITDYAHDYSLEMSFYNTLPDISENYVRDIQTQGHPELTPSSPTSQLLKDVGSSLHRQILLHVPRVEGDGAEYPDHADEGGGQLSMGLVGSGQLLLCDAVLDFVVQLLSSQHHWLCHQRVLTALRNILGRTVDRWVRETVSSLTTEERCLYYIRLLRETVWPGGKFFSSSSDEKTEEEKLATRTVAKRLLLDFFPGAMTMIVGADSMQTAVDVMLESLQYTQLNKHFLYTTIDMLLESLFPEIADPQFPKVGYCHDLDLVHQ